MDEIFNLSINVQIYLNSSLHNTLIHQSGYSNGFGKYLFVTYISKMQTNTSAAVWTNKYIYMYVLDTCTGYMHL